MRTGIGLRTQPRLGQNSNVYLMIQHTLEDNSPFGREVHPPHVVSGCSDAGDLVLIANILIILLYISHIAALGLVLNIQNIL